MSESESHHHPSKLLGFVNSPQRGPSIREAEAIADFILGRAGLNAEPASSLESVQRPGQSQGLIKLQERCFHFGHGLALPEGGAQEDQ